MFSNQPASAVDPLTSATLNPGMPSASALDEFQIKLVQMGDMTSAPVLTARVDLSRQYAAEGPQWVALESAADFRAGQTIPCHRVEGWRAID